MLHGDDRGPCDAIELLVRHMRRNTSGKLNCLVNAETAYIPSIHPRVYSLISTHPPPQSCCSFLNVRGSSCRCYFLLVLLFRKYVQVRVLARSLLIMLSVTLLLSFDIVCEYKNC